MTPNQLKEAGEFLFPGPEWKGQLANAIGVSRHTVRRWSKGEFLIPDDKEKEIQKLFDAKIKLGNKLSNRSKPKKGTTK